MNDSNAGRLDEFLDGARTPEEVAALERDMAADPEFRDLVELQARIDDRLRAITGAPAFPGLHTRPPPPRRLTARTILYAAAAAVLLAFLAGYWAWGGSGRAPMDPAKRLAAIHARAVMGGMTPRWVCETDEEFIATTRDRLGEGLLVEPREGLTLIGWDYDYLYTDRTCVLLARADGREVVVVMDRAASERGFKPPSDRDIQMHRRVVDGIVLYELGVGAEPCIIDRVRAAGR